MDTLPCQLDPKETLGFITQPGTVIALDNCIAMKVWVLLKVANDDFKYRKAA